MHDDRQWKITHRWFVCTLGSPPARQIYLVGKHLSERSGVSFPVTVGIIVFYNKLNNVWGQTVKDGGAAVK